MDGGDDELGNFFAEIEEIEAQPTVDTAAPSTAASTAELTADAIEEALEQVSASRPSTVTVVAASAAPSVVYSKPAEMNKDASNAVYTYNDYSYANADLTPANPYAASSSGYYGQSDYGSSGGGSSSTFQAPYFPVSTKKFVRKAADEVWVDDTLKEWPENDYRIFVGDLAKETTTDHLTKAFQHYKSFAKAKVSEF